MQYFFEKTYYENTIGEWVLALLIVAGALILAKILYWLTGHLLKRLASRTKSQFDDILIDMLEEPIVAAIGIGGFWYALSTLNMSEDVSAFFHNVFYAAIVFDVSWLIIRVIDALIIKYIKPFVDKSDGDLDDQLLPIFRKSLKTVIWTVAVIVGLNNAGYDVGALLAGLGLGGLAMAMAAKDSVSNLFGGLTVFMDKPFKIGDRIKIGSFDGKVIEIGMRSTRLRTLEGRLVTIPNKEFTESYIENVSSEPSRKIFLKLALSPGTKPEQIENALSILRQLNANHAKTTDFCDAGFENFGEYSLNLLFVYYIIPNTDLFSVQTEINLEILKQFHAAGLEFALPLQTVRLVEK